MPLYYPPESIADEATRKRTTEFFTKLVKPGDDSYLAGLVKQGICLEVRTPDSYSTPLIEAASAGKLKTVQALIAAGADIEARNYEGKTALMSAARRDIKEVIDALLTVGANIEAQDNDGKTPICNGIGISAIQQLFLNGANIYHCDKKGHAATGISYSYQAPEKAMTIFHWVADEPFIHESEQQYEDFIADHKAPSSTRQIYKLLACMALASPSVPLDFRENLQSIFAHTHWENKERAENILKEMQHDGRINAETAESILAATFPQERAHNLQRSGRER